MDLDTLSEEHILDLRICDIPLCIEGTWSASCVDERYHEFALKHIYFRLHCYLSDEWRIPDKNPLSAFLFI